MIPDTDDSNFLTIHESSCSFPRVARGLCIGPSFATSISDKRNIAHFLHMLSKHVRFRNTQLDLIYDGKDKNDTDAGPEEFCVLFPLIRGMVLVHTPSIHTHFPDPRFCYQTGKQMDRAKAWP